MGWKLEKITTTNNWDSVVYSQDENTIIFMGGTYDFGGALRLGVYNVAYETLTSFDISAAFLPRYPVPQPSGLVSNGYMYLYETSTTPTGLYKVAVQTAQNATPYWQTFSAASGSIIVKHSNGKYYGVCANQGADLSVEGTPATTTISYPNTYSANTIFVCRGSGNGFWKIYSPEIFVGIGRNGGLFVEWYSDCSSATPTAAYTVYGTGTDYHVRFACYDATNNTLVFGTSDGTLIVWDVASQTVTHTSATNFWRYDGTFNGSKAQMNWSRWNGLTSNGYIYLFDGTFTDTNGNYRTLKQISTADLTVPTTWDLSTVDGDPLPDGDAGICFMDDSVHYVTVANLANAGDAYGDSDIYRFSVVPTVRIFNTWLDTEWASSTPGASHLYPDIDGHSVWALQHLGTGVKKVDLDTLAITKTWTYSYASGQIPYYNSTAFFFQDSAGKVYTMDAVPYPANLKKLDPASSFAEIGSLAVPSTMTNVPVDWRVVNISGTDYLTYMVNTHPAPWGIINLTTMAMVGSGTLGTYEHPTTPIVSEYGWATFMDDSNNIWFVTQTKVGTYPNSYPAYHFYKSTSLGTPTLQFDIGGTGVYSKNSGFAFVTFIPGTNSVFLGNSIQWTGDVSVVNLGTGTITKQQADDLQFFYNGTIDAAQDCMRYGFQNSHLPIPSDDINPGLNRQRGGWFRLINPSTFAVSKKANITHTILNHALDALQNSPGINYRGVFSGSNSYVPADAVQGSNGRYYICIANTSSDPVSQQIASDASLGNDHWTTWVPILPNAERSTPGVRVITGNTRPWNVASNPTKTYSGSGTGSAPQTYGLSVGDWIQVEYTSGTIDIGSGANDAAGASGPPYSGGTSGGPSQYIQAPYYHNAGGLIGCFTDFSGVIIGQPFSIGKSSRPLLVPAGTYQICLGVDATNYSTNTGTWTVKISPVPMTPPPSSMIWYDGTRQSLAVTYDYQGAPGYLLNYDPPAGPINTLTSVGASPNPAVPSTSVTLTATITPVSGAAPSIGTVEFFDGATSLGTATPTSGVATLSQTFAVGTHSITATFTDGTSTYNSSTSSPYSLVIAKATTTTTVTSSQNPSYYPQAVTFTVNVTSATGTPTGTVVLSDAVSGGASTAIATLTLSGGSATFTANALQPGTHAIDASYGGDGDHITSIGTLSQQVNDVLGQLLPGFALIADYTTTGDDSLPPNIQAFSVTPNPSVSNSAVFFLWTTLNIAQVQITADNGTDPAFDSGLITTSGSGIYKYATGFTVDTTVKLDGFDGTGTKVASATVALVIDNTVSHP